MQDRFVFANGAIAASWTIFMGQAEHGSDLPWLPFFYKMIDRRPKDFALVAIQLGNTYIYKITTDPD